jgi:hypothetical protein
MFLQKGYVNTCLFLQGEYNHSLAASTITGMIVLFRFVVRLLSLALLVFICLIEASETGRMDTF